MADEQKPKESIVFLGVEMGLFESCFIAGIKDDVVPSKSWKAFEFIVIDDESENASSELSAALASDSVQSVVFQSTSIKPSLLKSLVNFYNSGGLVVFFGIYGEFSAPNVLSNLFSLEEPWNFSAYTSEDYEVTYRGYDYFGFSVKEQSYTKSNLLSVPIQDRLMVAKAQPLHHYISEHAGDLNGSPPDEEWNEDVAHAKATYLDYCARCYLKCPLALHKNAKGGKLAYIGFVNGEGNVSLLIRSLVTRKTLP